MCIQPSNRSEAVNNWNIDLILSNISSYDVDGDMLIDIHDRIGTEKFEELAKLIRKAKAKEFDKLIKSIEITTEMFEGNDYA